MSVFLSQAHSSRKYFGKNEHLFAHAESKVDLPALKRSRSARDIAQSVVVPMFGFSSVEAYYEGLIADVQYGGQPHACAAAAMAQYLPRLQCPVLYLNSLDDPLSEPDKVLPYEEFVTSCCPALFHDAHRACHAKNVALVVTRSGGHGSFATGALPLYEVSVLKAPSVMLMLLQSVGDVMFCQFIEAALEMKTQNRSNVQ